MDDVPKAIAFYQALFGWDIQAGGPEVGGYAVAHLNDRIVAGLGPKFGAPDAPSAWTTYLAADDADAVAEKIKAAGGQVVQGPMDVMEEGRMAIAFDTTGAPFGLWQGGKTTGVGLANDTGALTWNEHVSWDFDAGKAFYRAVFGYEYQDVSGDGFRYAMLMVDGREVGGIGQYTAGDTDRDPGRLEHLLRRRRHRRRGGLRRRARRQRHPAHQGQPVRPDRRRHRQPGRGLLADHQPGPGEPARRLVVLLGRAHQDLVDRHATGLVMMKAIACAARHCGKRLPLVRSVHFS